jgi:DNA-binding sugar fermentation-stimulating protein
MIDDGLSTEEASPDKNDKKLNVNHKKRDVKRNLIDVFTEITGNVEEEITHNDKIDEIKNEELSFGKINNKRIDKLLKKNDLKEKVKR